MSTVRKSISKLKSEAWESFSKYIRLRDCLITTGTKEYGLCFTCGKRYHFKELDAGHFIDGRSGSVLFVEEIVHSQCRGCNRFKHGNKDVYTPKMIQLYGLKQVEAFWELKHKTKSWTREELEKLKKYYDEEYRGAYKNN